MALLSILLVIIILIKNTPIQKTPDQNIPIPNIPKESSLNSGTYYLKKFSLKIKLPITTTIIEDYSGNGEVFKPTGILIFCIGWDKHTGKPAARRIIYL